jgi:hypothetical protein
MRIQEVDSAVHLGDALSPNEGPLTVFVSSPFSEPIGERWALREALRERLRREGHRPWLYEINAKEYRRTGLTPREIIINAIEKSDVVITLYKSRAGSFLDNEPFYATAFETFHARRLGKKVYLYVLDAVQKPRLRGVLSVFKQAMPSPDTVSNDGSEKDLIERVVSDLAEFRNSSPRANLIATDNISLDANINDRDWLDGIHSRLGLARSLWSAREIAERVPMVTTTRRVNKDNRLHYAQVLAACAGVWANQSEYTRAIECGWAAVRIFMETGYAYEMIGEIQAVSGILNMANQIKNAYWVNTFGFQAASRLREAQRIPLLQSFNDSRGSIMRKLGKFGNARERIRKSMSTVGDVSAYSLAKYASAVALLGGKANVDSGLRLLYDVALPLALSTDQSVGYVQRDAARIALLVGDHLTAARLLTEAEKSCRTKGQLHTLGLIQRMKREVELS